MKTLKNPATYTAKRPKQVNRISLCNVAGIFIMENQTEIWRDIPNYEGDYQVSNFGRVKSLLCGKERILNPSSSSGYYIISLKLDNNKYKTKSVHQLVAIAFLDHTPCSHAYVVNHKDFNKQNNHVDNLEIVTHRENSNQKHIKSSSQYVGVFWNKQLNKWSATISIIGRQKYLGSFNNEYDAHLAYQKALNTLLAK